MEWFFTYIVAPVAASLLTTAAGCCLRWLWTTAKAVTSIDTRLAALAVAMLALREDLAAIGRRLDAHDRRISRLEGDRPEQL